jgi:hypothetical protein
MMSITLMIWEREGRLSSRSSTSSGESAAQPGLTFSETCERGAVTAGSAVLSAARSRSKGPARRGRARGRPGGASKPERATEGRTPHSAKYLSSLSSRSVRRQNIECSNGAIFLMATLAPELRWIALTLGKEGLAGQLGASSARLPPLPASLSTRRRLVSRPSDSHDTVGALANNIEHLVARADVEADLARRLGR